MKKLISLILILSMLLSAFSFAVTADLPTLDENELEIMFPEGDQRWVASVTLNQNGDGLAAGNWQLLDEETDLVGLYWVAKNANGKGKVLQYAYGEAEQRKNHLHTQTVSDANGEYKMVRFANSQNWIPGTWTGEGLKPARAYGYGQSEAKERWLVPNASISPELAEKYYLYTTNDKESTLALYKANFGEDSEVYALVESYYGDLDEEGIASAASEIEKSMRDAFEGNIIRYALTPEEIIPVNELKSIKFDAFKHMGAISISGKVQGEAVFHIVLPDGTLVSRTWTSEATDWKGTIEYTVDVQSIPELPTQGWIVGIELIPLGKVADDAKIKVVPRNLAEVTQHLRFANTQFMPIVYPEANVITEQETTPELKYSYAGNGQFLITVTNAEADAIYAYRGAEGDWTTLSAGESSFTVDRVGYYYVKAVGTQDTVDSVIVRVKVESKQSIPELTLGEGYTLTAPDDAVYEYANLAYGEEYRTLTTATLTAGVWAVRKAGRDILLASEPQYFYIEGEDAGSVIYATADGTEFVKGRWTGNLGKISLFDNNATWTSIDALGINAGIGTDYFNDNTYSTYGFKYLFRESEIIPVSALNDIKVTYQKTTPIFTNSETGASITKSKTLARVYVIGADDESYDVETVGDISSMSFALSQLADKEGWVTAIEFYPIYQLLDGNLNAVEKPQIDTGRSWILGLSPVEMDETVNLESGNNTGIDADGKNKFSLKLADKAETPILSVERAGDKFKITVINAVDGYTYQYKSESSQWVLLEKGVKSFTVDSFGTYSVKTVTDGKVLSSDVATISFEGIKDAPNLVLGDGNVITAPQDGETYQYAKAVYGKALATLEYSDFTEETLTEGLWAVRVKGDGKILDSNPQIIYVMGEDAGTVTFATSTSLEMEKGLWTGTKGSAKLFDWDNLNDEATRFTDEHIEIYYGFGNDYFTDNTYKNYGYRYILKDSEIVALEDLVDLNAKVKSGSNAIKYNGAYVHYAQTRARVHVIGGDEDYYDVYTVCKFNDANNGFDFALSQLNDKKGYVVAIELYLFDEFTDSEGNAYEANLTASGVSYGITFSNLIMHEEVKLASQANNNTGLSEEGDNRYSLTIANDPRAPKAQRLESDPNGIIIKNYIEGARYAWASSLDGEWTEFDGNSVTFPGYGSYYLKMIGDGIYPELINAKPFTTSDVVIAGATLVLDGAIGVKIYFDAVNGAEYKASYRVVDKTTSQEIYAGDNVQVTTAVDGRHSFVAPVYPKDANNLEIEATVKNLTDGFSHSRTISVPEYISELRRLAGEGNEEYTGALDLVDAIETYINYAHNFFYKSETELPGNITIDLDALNATPDYVIIDDGTLECASLYGVSLVLEGETSIRYYFDVTDADAFETYTAYCNESKLTAHKKSDSRYYFEVSDIAAHNINRPYTLELYDSDNNPAIKVTFRATNYIKGMINSTEERLPALMKALYNYYVECAEYYELSRNAGQRAEILAAMNRAKETTIEELNVREYPEYKCYDPEKVGYEHIEAITYDAFEYKGQKTKVFAYIGIPEGASADSPVPAVVLVHGGGGHPFMDWVKRWNDAGYAAIAMETTGCFPTEVAVSYNESTMSHFKHGLGVFAEEGYTAAPTRSYPTAYTPVEDQWAYHGLTQVILASNILRADERVDKNNIGIAGVSWGGTMVTQIIGYDDRYSFAIPAYGTAYLGDELRPFASFADPYVNSLWASERNLDNVDIPTFWFVWNDDNNFVVPAYCKSYLHTATNNEKNTLLMLDGWHHSHGSVYGKPHGYLFADWVTYGKGGFITFADQPKGAKVNCNLNIPEGVSDITATVYYLTGPMEFDSSGYLIEKWTSNTTCLTVDKETGVVSGTVPEEAYGYYINVKYQVQIGNQNSEFESSSIYVELG